MVGQHPELYGLPEVNLFGADTVGGLDRWFRIRPNLKHGLLRALAQLSLGEQTEVSVAAAEEWLSGMTDQPTADIFRDMAEWAAPRHLVDKSPLYVIDTGALARIDAAFPGARYLHLTRHPVTTCESVYKIRADIQTRIKEAGLDEHMKKQAEWRAHLLDSYNDPESLWLEPHLKILEFLQHIPDDRQLRIKGEDLIRSPESHLGKIAKWLGVSADAKAISAMLHPESSPFACLGPSNAKFGNDPNFLEHPEFRPHEPKEPRLTDAMEGHGVLSANVLECAYYLGYA